MPLLLSHMSGTAGGDINEKPTIIAPKASKPQEASAVPSYLAKKMNPQPSQDSAQQVKVYINKSRMLQHESLGVDCN